MDKPIIVSVVMITYNHEDYVEEAINSILSQKCDFNFEFIISDDKSSDKTITKIESIITKHPKGNCVRLIKQDPNIGMMNNFNFVLQEAKGKYIAICEGDDYWTDNSKLQKQFEVLENRKEIVLSFHNAIILNETTKNSNTFCHYKKDIYSGKELFDQWLIPTASAFFRNVIPTTPPPFLKEGTHGDMALFLFLGEHGDFHYIDSQMSVYRINDTGVTQSAFKGLEHNSKHIKQLEDMEVFFGSKYAAQLNERISLYLLSNAQHYAAQKNKLESRKNLSLAIKRTPSLRLYKFVTIAKIIVKNYT
jgi:glycosyltransferase involved in cell wall biosynthesis